MTNEDFAKRVGCHFTMASRLRNGDRLPSVKTLIKISTEFNVPVETLTRAHAKGAPAFSKLLRDRIFETA
jgi:transcriptional regulator with XRE-family HTH domain